MKTPALLLLLLAACAVPARQTVAPPEAPPAWSEPQASTANPEVRWWSSFGDPVLDGLVQQAVAGNLDLALARSRVREARALYRAAGGSLEPHVDLSAGYERSKPSENTAQGALSGEGDLWQFGFDASWELDFFGRNAAEVAAALHGAEAADFELRDALVALCSELARNYVELCGLEQELRVVQANAELQRDTLGLTRSRFDAGLATGLDVARAEAQFAGTESGLPRLEARRRASLQRIAVLLGRLPESLPDGVLEPRPLPAPPETLAAGTPSELLRRRADVRSAERQLAAFRELARVAESDLYPRIRLQAALGKQSSQFRSLLDASSRAWSVGPSILMPIFDRAAIRDSIAAAGEREVQALIVYQKSVLTAFAEVEDALTAVARERERMTKLTEALAASERALGYANELQARGLVDFFQVLDAQRARLAADSELAQSQTALAENTIALYKALGGGWEAFEASR